MAQTSTQISSPINNQGLSETNNSPQQQNPKKQQDTSFDETRKEREKFLDEIRGSLMTVAILAAGSTYQSGLNPPGGFWQDNNNGHVAGNPILHDNFYSRYQAFFYCNAISFLSSLVIIVLLMSTDFYNDTRKIQALKITMVLDLFSFMAAYAAGSCRSVASSIYVFLLIGGVFLYVVSFARHYSVLHGIARQMPCLKPCMKTEHGSEA